MFLNRKTIHFSAGSRPVSRRIVSRRIAVPSSSFSSASSVSSVIVIIAAYKASSFIEECLDSIVSQEGFYGEILLGIDGCPETLDTVKSIMGKYPDLKVYYSEINTGPYMVYNFLLSLLKPEDYFLIFGADDTMNPGMIRSLSSDSSPKISRWAGILYIQKNTFNKIGSFRPWRCEADSDSISRLRLAGVHVMVAPKYYTQHSHPNQLTKGKLTGQRSELRKKYRKITSDNLKSKRTIFIKPEVNNMVLISSPLGDKIVSVGLPVFNSPISWLAMESLCNQETTCNWELIIYEDGGPRNEEFYQSYKSRLKNCQRITYIYSSIRIPLPIKWIEMSTVMKNSYGLLLQASDCYSEPNRIQSTFDLFKSGADWIDSPRGYFYNIDTEQMIIYDHNSMTNLNMAINKDILKQVRKIVKWSGIDGYLFKEMKRIKPDCKVVRLNSLTWDKGVDTDGRNSISLKRRLHYDNPKPPFKSTKEKIDNILPPDIVNKLKLIRDGNRTK